MSKLTVPNVFSCQFPIYTVSKNNNLEVKSLFEKAVDSSKRFRKNPSNETLLQLYALYKQATIGDADLDNAINSFDFVAKAKHDAWLQQKGKLKAAAQLEYIVLVNKING